MKEYKEPEELRAKYGKGFDLIKKMGFRGGGLGVDGNGISEPIQVMVRPANLGITGENSIHSDASENAPILSEGVKDLEEGNKRQKTARVKGETDQEAKDPRPSGAGPGFPKKAYLDDVMESVSIQRDIYGEKRRELEGYLSERQLEIQTLSESLVDLNEKKLIMESLSVVTKQVQRAFLKFQCDLEKVTEDEIVALFEVDHEREPSSNESEDCQDQIDSLEKVVREFSQSFERILGSCNDASSREVCKSYLPYCSMIRDILRTCLQRLYKKDRDMRLDPDFGISAWISIKTLFVALQTSRREREYDSKHCFEQLVMETVGRHMEVYFTCSWDPIRENEYGISLLNIWTSLIPSEFVRTRLMEAIWSKQIHRLQFGRMESGFEDIPQTSKHKWLFLWLPYYYKFGMGYKVSRVISRHIDAALDEWEPPEEWPLSLLTVWKPILETQKEDHETEELDGVGWTGHGTRACGLFSKELDSIILASIYPKLLSYFGSSFLVEPDHRSQELECIEHLELWFNEDLVDRSLVSQIFTEEVGPKWIRALEAKLFEIRREHRSLQDSRTSVSDFPVSKQRLVALYTDLLEWYRFWREVFSKGALASSKSKAFLAKALVYMDYHVNFHSDLAPELKRSTYSWVDYESCGDKEAEIAELQDLRDDTLMLGVLEWISDETGLVIRQSARKDAHGRQILSIEYGEDAFVEPDRGRRLGGRHFRCVPTQTRLLFYICQGVIFMRDDLGDSEDWVPVSIPSMLARLGIQQTG